MRLLNEVGAIDRALLVALAGRRVPRLLDRFFRSVTHLGGVTATVGLALLFLADPSSRPLGFTFSLAHLLSHALAQVLKRTVTRDRPETHHDTPASLITPPDAFSFPSGHACASMTTALVLTLTISSSLGIALVLVALAVGFSRIYLRVHYATDVLVGQLLGAASALAAVGLLPA